MKCSERLKRAELNFSIFLYASIFPSHMTLGTVEQEAQKLPVSHLVT